MRLLRLAVETQNWALAAHTIVLATAIILKTRGSYNAKSKAKKESLKGQSKR